MQKKRYAKNTYGPKCQNTHGRKLWLLDTWAWAHGPGPMGPGPMGPGPKGQSAQRAHRPMAQGPSAHGPGPIGPKGPLGSPGETPLGSQGTPPGIPRDPLKSLFFKNRFFKKISVKLHQWVFYRTYPYDNTTFDNDFSRILSPYRFTLPFQSVDRKRVL